MWYSFIYTQDYAKKLTLIMLTTFYKKWGVIVSKITIFLQAKLQNEFLLQQMGVVFRL